MSNTFTHKFCGWKSAEARRWTNPDGSVGGIVAVSAKIDESVYIAGIGYSVSVGARASIGASDWFMAGGPCGSRNAMWTAVASKEHGLRWWVGCKHGITSEQLRALVKETHGTNEHAQDYLAAIKFVEKHPGYARWKLANEVRQ